MRPTSDKPLAKRGLLSWLRVVTGSSVLLIAERPKVFIATQVECVVNNCWGGLQFFAYLIPCYDFKLIAWLDHEHGSALGGDKNSVAGSDWCGIIFTAHS